MYGQGPGSSLGCVSEWTYNLNLIHYNHQRQADPSSNSGLIYFSFCLSLSLPWYLSCQTQFLYLSFFRSFLYLYIAPFFVFSLAFKCELNLSLLRLFFLFFLYILFYSGNLRWLLWRRDGIHGASRNPDQPVPRLFCPMFDPFSNFYLIMAIW